MALPPPPAAKAQQPADTAKKARFGISSGRQVGAQRVLLYGPGGVGKSELCTLAPNPIFIDLESGSRSFDVSRVDGIETYNDVREVITSYNFANFDTVVIDTATKLEELALIHVLSSVPHEKPGNKITSIESYGFGKGYRHLYDAFTLILPDCDRLIRSDKNVVLVAHSCTNEAPNPTGENWLRYEPRLQHPKKENSVRDRCHGWADHVLFIGYDVAATRDGKGVGSGSRTIYTQEYPSHIAKTRGAFDASQNVPPSLPYPKGDDTIWQLILGDK